MSLKLYFPPSDHPRKVEFDALLDSIFYQTDSYCYVAHYKSGRFHYTSPSFETITGYTTGEFEEQGVSFLVKRIPEEDNLQILKNQVEYFKKVLHPDFDLLEPEPLTLPARVKNFDGSLVKYVCVVMPMAFLPNREVDFGISIVQPADEANYPNQVSRRITEQLKLIKLLYNSIYSVTNSSIDQPSEPIEIVSSKDPHHPLSSKEKQVLQKIAQGASSKEIAAALFISENTVETHRKNLLLKLEAKNVAELIKKASKLYWLE